MRASTWCFLAAVVIVLIIRPWNFPWHDPNDAEFLLHWVEGTAIGLLLGASLILRMDGQ